MVTKRRTSTEQEKSRNTGYEKDVIDSYDTINVSASAQKPVSETREFEFSGPTSTSRIIYSDPVTVPKKESTEKDYMPSIRTMEYLNRAKEMNKNSREKMEGKTKIMLAVYMLAVIVLSAIVIATGIAVSNVSNRVENLETEYVAKAEVVDTQNNQIDKLSDPDYITGRAYGNGMKGIEETEEIPLLAMNNSVSYEPRTNWFDSFCKWVSSLIGG